MLSHMKILTLLLAALPSLAAAATPAGPFCPEVYPRGVLDMPFNPSFLHVQRFKQPDGTKADGLLMSSFFNVQKNAEGTEVERYLNRDLVARIRSLDRLDPARFAAKRDVQILTDLDSAADLFANRCGSAVSVK